MACKVTPTAIMVPASDVLSIEIVLDESKKAHVVPIIPPSRMPGQTRYPYIMTAASAIPDGGQIEVTLPGGMERNCPILAPMK